MGCLQSRHTDAVESKPGSGVNGVAAKPPGKQPAPGAVGCGSQKGVPPTREFSDINQKNYDETGLSHRQVFSLKQSWKGIKRKMEETGVEMFVRLFKTNSDLQTLFQGFKHIQSDDELRSNEALEYHATLVMTTLDDAITHIDNYEFVRQLLHKTGASHIKFEGFHPDNFMQMREPFLEAVRVTLGDRYTENMQTIYTIAITFILQQLIDGIKEAMQAKGITTGAHPAGSVIS
ncbi:neuroglobin [Plakobranchus ocellatus]|uniref:Globin n=1 Tax=Plakobranchus ocellatus TaxID=259542 RepID=A0AAV4B937_9GAST|nr:neuroglobin [Plakobranchus ocellatus]